MSVADMVQCENHSLKQYTAGSEAEMIRVTGVLIKVDSTQYTPEYRNRQKETSEKLDG